MKLRSKKGKPKPQTSRLRQTKVSSTRGLFITLEGTEGSGKSTLIRELGIALKDRGVKFITTREPGGSPVAEAIRNLVLNFEMAPKTELFLYEAARAEHLAKVILPALKKGIWVLCDRYSDSTLAYQAYARGLDWDEVLQANRLATDGLLPDWTLWLDVDPKVGLDAALDPNRFEAEGVAFQRKVRKGFEKARLLRPARWIKLKGHSAAPKDLALGVLNLIYPAEPKPPAQKRRKEN